MTRIFVYNLKSIICQLTYVCCGVAVLQFSKGYSYTLKILLYLYVNIEFIFDFHITFF